MQDDGGRLRFGIFMAPFHPAGENPTLLLDGDVALVEHLDRLGYDEAWIGEHHSAGEGHLVADAPSAARYPPNSRANQPRVRLGAVNARPM